ncbi:MAG: hypothetical protein U0350_14550 [Caldilineaceae bacterium]
MTETISSLLADSDGRRITLALPAECARCAQASGAVAWQVEGYHGARVHPLSLLLIFIGRVMVQHKKHRFVVGVCPACHASLCQTRLFTRAITVGAALLGGLIAMFQPQPIFGEPPYGGFDWVEIVLNGLIGGCIGVVVGLLIGYLVQRARGATLGHYNGTYLRFTNPTYQRAFGALNPHLVKPSPIGARPQ